MPPTAKIPLKYTPTSSIPSSVDSSRGPAPDPRTGQMSNVVASFSGMTMSMPESCEWMMGVSVGDIQMQGMDLTLATSMMGDVRKCGVDMWAAMKVAAADMMNANINVATTGDTSTLDLDQVVVLSDITDSVEMVAYAVEEAVIAFVSVVNEAEAAAAEMQDGGV